MFAKLIDYLRVPDEVTSFERAYLAKMSRIARAFFVAHVPVLVIVAAACHTGPWKALALSLGMLAGPFLAARALGNPRHVARAFGVTAMGMGALLVHFGQGPMQIEMHFYFFVLLALLVVFADPMVVVLATVTVTLHHAVLYFALPASVFNYEASLWAVAVHALFILLESAAACFVARTFFDSVIGLEKAVESRTDEVRAQTQQLRVMLDNVGQGFLAFDRAGVIAAERSTTLERWLGPCAPGMRIADYLARRDVGYAREFELGLEQVLDDVLPLELALAQMPKRMTTESAVLDIGYKPIFTNGALTHVLMIVSDVSYRVEAERSEAEAREMLAALEAVVKDRVGFAEFMREGDALVARLVDRRNPSETHTRDLHTLKGACGLLGLSAMAAFCHELEERGDDGTGRLSKVDSAALAARWGVFSAKLATHFGDLGEELRITSDDCARVLRAVEGDAAREAVAAIVGEWKLEATHPRLQRIAEQARAMAVRLDKGRIHVDVDSHDVRLTRGPWAPIWTVLPHVVRNAIDHGLEPRSERLAAAKSSVGRLRLGTFVDAESVVFEVTDDGRGVDWERVRARAVSLGLPCGTEGELLDALFHDGLTTNDEATHDSGRGMGMGAVRAACERLGGQIRVESTPSKSTRIELRIPIPIPIPIPSAHRGGIDSTPPRP